MQKHQEISVYQKIISGQRGKLSSKVEVQMAQTSIIFSLLLRIIATNEMRLEQAREESTGQLFELWQEMAVGHIETIVARLEGARIR